MWENKYNVYKSAVKLKEMALPQKNEDVTSILKSLEHQSAIIVFNNSDWHLRFIYVTPREVYFQEVWFLMGFYLISFELAKIQM